MMGRVSSGVHPAAVEPQHDRPNWASAWPQAGAVVINSRGQKQCVAWCLRIGTSEGEFRAVVGRPVAPDRVVMVAALAAELDPDVRPVNAHIVALGRSEPSRPTRRPSSGPVRHSSACGRPRPGRSRPSRRAIACLTRFFDAAESAETGTPSLRAGNWPSRPGPTYTSLKLASSRACASCSGVREWIRSYMASRIGASGACVLPFASFQTFGCTPTK